MAGLFGKKGPGPAEMRREGQIKKNITKEFSRALKTLQREHVISEQPIYSDEMANNVCNVLEAVFLHGLKGSVSRKISSYFTGSSTDSEAVNFWQLAKKFTHRDVVSTLNHLGQITTEIGMCRAWIRVALNECSMDSYVDAMLADTDTLRYYFKRTAYLRDLEEPGILKTYLQGLAEFQFELSYNARVLNLWTTAPLILSGLWETEPTPNAVVSSVSDGALSSSQSRTVVGSGGVVESTSPVVSHKTRSRPRATSSEKMRKTMSYHGNEGARLSSAGIPGPPPNSPYDASMFMNHPAEELKNKLPLRSPSPNLSEASSSSHISCPDPGTASQTNESAVYASSQLLHVQSQEMQVGVHTSGEINEVQVAEEVKELAHLDEQLARPGLQKSEPSVSSVVATAVETVREETAKERPSTLIAIPLGRTERANSVRSDYDPMKQDEVLSSTDRRTSVDLLSEHNSEQNYKTREGTSQAGGLAVTSNNTDGDDGGGIGNSLGKMSGWSSSFDPHEHHHGNLVASFQTVPVDRERGQSYGTLLQNYTSTSGTVSTPTMQEVLENLGGDGQLPQGQGMSIPKQPSRESSWSEYEIIPTPFSTDMLYTSSKMYESQISIMGEICNEKGLDMQNYQCKGCARPIGLIYGNPRVCSFDGCYYCYECHENEDYHIPSRIVQNWDFRKHKVAKKNFEFLREVEEHPLLDLEILNPKIYDHVNEMSDIKVLRQQLCFVKSYLFTCKQSVAEELRRSVWPKEYFYDCLHLYSLNDMLQVMSGQLAQTLRRWIRLATKHIYDCGLCSQKGFICEICNNPKVIYPFELDNTQRCPRCKAVYHRICKSETKHCPKCQRRMSRHSRVGADLITPDSDYAIHPDDQVLIKPTIPAQF